MDGDPVTLAILRALIYKAVHYPVPEVMDMTWPYYSPYYSLLYLLAQELDKKEGTPVFVELGVEKGRGVGAFALGSSRARIIGYDTTRRAEIDPLCRRFPNIEYRELASIPQPGMPRTYTARDIDVLHIDTEHSEANAREEFRHWESCLVDGAVVLFDDTHAMDDGVKRAVDELPYQKIFDDRLHPTCGYAVVLYER